MFTFNFVVVVVLSTISIRSDGFRIHRYGTVPRITFHGLQLSPHSCPSIVTRSSSNTNRNRRRSLDPLYGTVADERRRSRVAKKQELKVVSFNILAPCYKRLQDGSGLMEAEHKEMYLERNQAICQQLLASNADVICLQEFWCGSSETRKLYKDLLCGPNGGGYTLKELRRTSHWRQRDDGLACFVRNERLVIQDTRHILFHDCGDRVAQMLLLALRPPAEAPKNTPSQQFIVVNTHLLFPHNEYSTKIRLREMAKILGFVDFYRVRELCSTICGRSDVRLPVIIAGDFNGSPNGKVFKYCTSQNYKSSFVEHVKKYPLAELEPASKAYFERRANMPLEAIQYWGEYSDDREYSSSDINPDGDGIDDDDYFFGIDETNIVSSKTESSLSDSIHGLSMSAAALMSESEVFDYPVYANPFAPYAKSSSVSSSGSAQGQRLGQGLEGEEDGQFMTEGAGLGNDLLALCEGPTAQSGLSSGSCASDFGDAHCVFLSELDDVDIDVVPKDGGSFGIKSRTGDETSREARWISHRSHREENVAVDHVLYCNPSEQEEEKIAPIPDWTNLVYREIIERIIERYGISSMKEVFTHFDSDASNFVTLKEFEEALSSLGFVGEGQSALLPEEIRVLVDTADKDGNGMIDYGEFCDRFWLAANDKEQQQQYSYKFGKKSYLARAGFLSDSMGMNMGEASGEPEGVAFVEAAESLSSLPPSGTTISSSSSVATVLTAPTMAVTNTAPSLRSQMATAASTSTLQMDVAQMMVTGVSLDVRQMGDLTVQSARLIPEEMESGIWPDGYTLSDHGMVEVVFAVPPVSTTPPEIIDPQVAPLHPLQNMIPL